MGRRGRRPSPDEAPRSRRPTQGSAKPRTHAMVASRCLAAGHRPAAGRARRARARGRRPARRARAIAIRAWPRGDMWIRSVSHIRGSRYSRIRQKSTTRRAVGVGHLAHQLVVGREPAAHRPQHRRVAGVVRGPHQHPRAGRRPAAATAVVVGGDQRVEVDRRPQDVVGPGVDGHQVGLHRQRGAELLGEDRPQRAGRAPPGWRSGSRGRPRREHLRHPVGPAAHPVGHASGRCRRRPR